VSEELPDADTVPGTGSGESAPTREIPRVPPPAKKSPAKKASASAQTPVTDKGRTREIPHVPAPPKPVTPSKDTTSEKPTEPETLSEPTTLGAQAQPAPEAGPAPKRTVEPVTGSTGRTLTAADYAKTTNPSPSTTAVIPAVRDDSMSGRQMTFSESEAHGRRASLRLTRVEPWSVTRLAFAISVAMMIVGVVAVTIFWLVLEATGVWDQINDSVTSVLSDDSSTFSITDYLGFGRMVGLTLVLSAINVVLMTALATIGAHLYNIAADLLGGIEVTFSEEK
jgi:Transmembrane domain of unknown function (DUF3566)